MTDNKTGIYVHVPDTCEVCGQWTGRAYDVHMVVAHPETRPKPDWFDPSATKKKKKK